MPSTDTPSRSRIPLGLLTICLIGAHAETQAMRVSGGSSIAAIGPFPPDGDINQDGTLNLSDWSHWSSCETGPGTFLLPGLCEYFDVWGDSAVDLRDFRFLQLRFGSCYSHPDFDNDGFADSCDNCPSDFNPSQADEDGNGIGDVCYACETDSDNDDVPDCMDQCPETPVGIVVDQSGCPATTPPVCGNNVVEPGEDCEPPNSATCDANCQAEIRFIADACDYAQVMVGESTVVFDTTLATMDGPPHTACVSFGNDQIDHDVWVCWGSPCTGTVFLQTCGLTGVDTKLAVYEGCECPATDARLLSCNDDACSSSGVQSLVTFEAVVGQAYLLRIGTFPGEPGGSGGINISCSLPACGDKGDCFASHATPGCKDTDCCEKTCQSDPFCCDIEWDMVCAEQAQGLCTGHFPACQPGLPPCTQGTTCFGGSNNGHSCTHHGQCPGGGNCSSQPGCGDVDCCNTVCAGDPYCCLEEWDNVCAEREASMCHSACGPDAGDPFTPRTTPGSNNEACCGEVCTRDPTCCQEEWDQPCVDLAEDHCQ